MKKKFSINDERELNTFRKICTTMYLLTLFALMGIVSYRQFVLDQPHQQWNDIAMLMTINVIVVFGAFLYLTGSINPTKIKIRYLVAGYVGFVLFGFAFTLFKYAILEGLHVDLAFAFDRLKTILAISGLLVLAWGLLAYFGNKRLEHKIK
jgi:hypothetical protein